MADLFLGDIPLSWDRRQAVEFTFFTLADSGAFVTHSPRKLSEVLVLIRPFMWNVWPVLLFTVLITAPALYIVIILPYQWQDKYENFKLKPPVSSTTVKSSDSLASVMPYFDPRYLDEITYGHRPPGETQLIQYRGIPKKMFDKVSWFVVNMYLKQSVEFKFTGHRVRFLAIMIWLGATYVLGDMYSAQLTSQLARPAKEKPISKSVPLVPHVIPLLNVQTFFRISEPAGPGDEEEGLLGLCGETQCSAECHREQHRDIQAHL